MRPTGMQPLVVVVVALVAALVTGCGTEKGTGPQAEGAWSTESLTGARGADSRVGLATSDEDVMVVMVDDKGQVHSHVSRSGQRFASGEPFATGSRYAQLADPVRHDGQWLLVGSGGLVEDGRDEEFLFEPIVLRSDDGLTWTRLDATGFSAPVEVNEVVSVGGALVAVGAYRVDDDPSTGGFRAMAWRSSDGSSWTEVALPGGVPDPTYETESYASHVVAVDGRLVTGGAVSGQGSLWSSADAGETWERVDARPVAELYAVSGLASVGPSLVVSGSSDDTEAEGSVLLVSDDGAATWRRPEEPPPGQGEGFAPLWAAGGRFLTTTVSSLDPFGDPGVCYADLDQCTAQGEMTVWASDDGDVWRPVDTSGAEDALIGFVGTDSGRLLLAEAVSKGVAVHSWPAEVDLPAGTPPEPPRGMKLVMVPEKGAPEVGVRYHAPLYVHCGMDWLYLGDTVWRRTDGGVDVETGAGDEVPESWPVAGQTIYGYATLSDEGIVEYSIGEDPAEAEVIATYARAERGVGCA